MTKKEHKSEILGKQQRRSGKNMSGNGQKECMHQASNPKRSWTIKSTRQSQMFKYENTLQKENVHEWEENNGPPMM